MARARKIEVSALQGIHLHDGFLGEETILRLVQHDNYKSAAQTLVNDRLRSFRDNYRDFSRNIERLQKKNQIAKSQLLISEWISSTTNYLGFSAFELSHVPHWEEGKIHYLSPKEDSHSVAVFFANSVEAVAANITDRVPLTAPTGEGMSSSSRKETLFEQVEKAIHLIGLAEALLITPNAVYYFRADSQVSGQCLEVRWDEMLLSDNDQALALATYLLRSDFFSFSTSSPSSQEAQDEPETEEEDGSAGGEEESGAGDGAKLTQSSELFKENLDQAREITEDLHKQVVLALELLINERLAIDPELKSEGVKGRSNERVAQDLFKDGLFVLYRVLFLLYAESRGFLPVDNRRFSSFYSLEHLRDWSEDFLRKRNRGLGNTEGTYIWGALKSIFTLLRRGVDLPGGEFVSPYNGQLFAPDRAPYFDLGPELRDEAMAGIITALTRVGGSAGARRLHFANLGVEQLGAVYEALLAQTPVIVREQSIWVPAHDGGVGLVTKALANAIGLETYDDTAPASRGRRRQLASSEKLEKVIDPRRPAFVPSVGKFIVAPLGGQKRQTASFYTPPKLAEFLVKRTLKSLAEGKSSKDILNVRVVEPAMGSGGFLVQVVRYLASELLKAKIRERSIELRSGEKASFKDLQRCKREIVENCIFGVDINPLAIELARTSLYLEALVPGEPLPFLHHRLRSGNSLIGADFQNRFTATWEEGVEFPILFDIPVSTFDIDDKIWDAWDDLSTTNAKTEQLKQRIQTTKTNLKNERKKLGAEVWASWANGMQLALNNIMQLARKAQQDFEEAQLSEEIIEQLDSRFKDHLALIPDMDQVLIEAYGIEIDPALLKKRRKALLNEFGPKRYRALVERQRALTRLKALGDLSTALWYWPLDAYEHFPSHAAFRELCEWLLDSDSLQPDKKPPALSKQQFSTLRTAIGTARQFNFFHWQLEFASVFADPNRLGFCGCISNPPWKVIRLEDKDVFPEFDPQYLSTKGNERKSRNRKLVEVESSAAAEWFQRLFGSFRMSEHWRAGCSSTVKPTGLLDLCVLFALNAESIVRAKGRTGLILSRPAVYISDDSSYFRKHLFEGWGLKESVSFINTLRIFDIHHSRQFALLMGEKTDLPPTSHPKFIEGVIDLNLLPQAESNLDANATRKKPVDTGPIPTTLSLDVIKQMFSRESYTIPSIRSPKQYSLIEALHKASGEVCYLNELEANVRRGFDSSDVARAGKDLPKGERPTFNQIQKGNIAKWVPIFKGRDFNLFDPATRIQSTSLDPVFEKYGLSSKISARGVDLSRPILSWRAVSRIGNQRMLVCSIVPPGVWIDHNNIVCQMQNTESLLILQCLFSTLTIDFITRIVGSTKKEVGEFHLPIPTYNSNALAEAIKLTKKLVNKVEITADSWKSIKATAAFLEPSERKKIQAKIDALVWIHYGMNQGALDRAMFEWMLNTQFDCLNRNDPTYKELVLGAFDTFAQQPHFLDGPKERIFSPKRGEVVPIERQSPAAASERRVEERRKTMPNAHATEPAKAASQERRNKERRRA